MNKKKVKIRFYRKRWFFWLLVILFCLCMGFMSIRPSNDKNWENGQDVMPYSITEGETITIYNMRNFSWVNTSYAIRGWYNKTFNLSQLKRVDYIVEPFAGFPGAAHTFFSFDFNGEYVAVSVEARREKGEVFSVWKGLVKKFELIYIIGDERDLVKLRSNFRKDSMYIYPLDIEPKKVRLIFEDILSRANKLKQEPEFFNSLTNACITNTVDHLKKGDDGRLGFSWSILMPAYTSNWFYERSLIDTNLTFEEAKNYYNINERAEQYADDPNFSRRVREVSI